MIEGEPTDTTISDLLGEFTPEKQKISEFIDDISSQNSLDSDTTEALQRFGHIEHFAKSIKSDFRSERKIKFMLYPIMEKGNEGNPKKTFLYVTPQNYGEYVGVLSNTAFGIYIHDLQSESAKSAAHEIQNFIDGLLR